MSIASRLSQLSEIKTNIKNAIIAKGQTVDDNMTTYATAIGNISGGGSYSEDTLLGTSATVTTTVTNGTYTGATTIDSTATVTITASTGYNLPETISVTGATYTWNNTTGVISLSDPTSNVVINVECKNYEEPTQEGSSLTVTQFMSITQSSSDLEVE